MNQHETGEFTSPVIENDRIDSPAITWRNSKLVAAVASLSLLAGCGPTNSETSPADDASVTTNPSTHTKVTVKTHEASPKHTHSPDRHHPSAGPNMTAKPEPPEKTKKQAAPNIEYILVDDMQMSLMKRKYLPTVFREIVDKGVIADNAIAPQGLCCPARTSLFRGQYSHNTGIGSNSFPTGGFEKYHLSGKEKSSLPVWLQMGKKKNDEYDTALFGKYLNNYPFNYHKPSEQYVSDRYVPQGWSRWVSPVKGSPYGQQHYKLNVDGKVDAQFRNERLRPKDYLQDTLTDYNVDFIKHQQGPFFAELSSYTAHNPNTPARQDRHIKVDTSVIDKNPAYSEDVSDKPLLKNLPKLTQNEQKQIHHNFAQRVRAIRGLDRSVGRLIRASKQSGTYDNTYFIFTSDNGFHLGEHRMPMGKNTPYRTDTDVPFAMAGPGIMPGTHLKKVIANIDITATILDIANVKPPYALDGTSFLPLVQGKDKPWSDVRLLERGNSQGYSVTADGLNEPADNPREDGITSTVPYEGVRDERYKYVVYNYKAGTDNTKRMAEMYDMLKDPYELQNLLGKDQKFRTEKSRRMYAPELGRMRKDLGRLATCKGADCYAPAARAR